ncbi:unnamed protein product [Didymodactylos carnosus]|nr:unnamed protein product [Didymodactylos carnosus]CAF3904180.1 unnamed protein product [Didymodactylos carnosus]
MDWLVIKRMISDDSNFMEYLAKKRTRLMKFGIDYSAKWFTEQSINNMKSSIFTEIMLGAQPPDEDRPLFDKLFHSGPTLNSKRHLCETYNLRINPDERHIFSKEQVLNDYWLVQVPDITCYVLTVIACGYTNVRFILGDDVNALQSRNFVRRTILPLLRSVRLLWRNMFHRHV